MNVSIQKLGVRMGGTLVLENLDLDVVDGEDMTARARSAPRPQGAQARSLRSGRAYGGPGDALVRRQQQSR
jgi:hypothetical protein